MEKSKFFVNNQPRRYCETHIILFPKTNLKRIKLIKNHFSKNFKNENIIGPIHVL